MIKKILQFLTTMTALTVVTNSSALSKAPTTDWMTQIPDNRVLNQLIIPGTHNSATSNITENSYFSYSDQKTLPSWLQVIANIIPHSALRSIAADWSKTQPYSITQQLNSGIRYFDLHVCYENVPNKEDDLFLCNSLTSEALSDALNDIVMFTSNNPSEFVIINISHVNGIENAFQETDLISQVDAILFGSDIPNTLSPNATMGALRKTNRHIIIMMNPPQYGVNDPSHRLDNFLKSYLWPESNIDAPEPNASDIITLKKALDTEVAYRATTQATSHQFSALQITQTPSAMNIINGILDKNQYPHSLQTYETPVNAQLGNWVNSYIEQYHASALNIVMQDWFTDSSPLVPLAIQYDSLPSNELKTNEEKEAVLQQKLLQLKQLYKQRT